LLNDKYQLKDNSAVRFHSIAGLSDIENMMFWDIDSYLKEDILTKVDRAAMANSLETRAPFLDINVAKSAWRFKENFLIDGFKGKMPLRKILESYVPRKLFERPKSGFGIPIGSWLRGPLKGWALSLLNENEIRDEGILKYETVIKLWEDHINFRYDNTVKLWNILVFRSWMVDNNKN
jgi:asparagine synthase (glutamine-hydrolysing)